MQLPTQNKKMVWTGHALSVSVSLLLAFSAVMKLMTSPEILKGMDHLGIPHSLITTVGILEISCVIVYLVPATSVVGAILLTGYMGGAILTHLRVGEAVPVQVLLGVVVWLGLYLREPRLHALLPLRKKASA